MIKHSIVYLFSSLFSKGAPFLLIPFLTLYLEPDEFGKVAIFQLMISTGLALNGNLHTNVPRAYFRLKAEEFRKYFSSIYLVLGALCIVYSIAFFVFSSKVNLLTGISESVIVLIPALSTFYMLNQIFLTYLRTIEKPFQFACWEIGTAIIGILLTILLLLYGLGWYARVYGIVAPVILTGLIGAVFLFKQGAYEFDWKLANAKEVLAISTPLIPHALSSVVIAASDLLFIENMIGPDSVGIYSLAYQVAMVVMLCSDAFLKAWQPWFFKTFKLASYKENAAVLKYSFLFILFIALFSVVYGVSATYLLPLVVSEKYFESADLVLPISVCFVFFAMYQMSYPYLVYLKDTRILALITPLAAATNLVFNYVLIPSLGFMGAIISTGLSYFVLFALTVLYLYKRKTFSIVV